jgi:hypothetical protein
MSIQMAPADKFQYSPPVISSAPPPTVIPSKQKLDQISKSGNTSALARFARYLGFGTKPVPTEAEKPVPIEPEKLIPAIRIFAEVYPDLVSNVEKAIRDRSMVAGHPTISYADGDDSVAIFGRNGWNIEISIDMAKNLRDLLEKQDVPDGKHSTQKQSDPPPDSVSSI